MEVGIAAHQPGLHGAEGHPDQALATANVCVVVPCYNEEIKIEATIRSIPRFVRRIYVVDDASKDRTAEIVADIARDNRRIVLIRHSHNKGVGAAISTGYLKAIDDDVEFAVVMAGDGQMDPEDLPRLLTPAIEGLADYVKGNRFFHHTVGIVEIPRHRLVGNLVLSILTKIAAGYWHVSDTQCGYTVINRAALKAVDWQKIYPRYGCPNDILTKLNIANMRVAEVAVRPRYGPDWSSKMNVRAVVFPILKLLTRLFLHRLFYKYIYLNGHPIILFYVAGAFFVVLSTILAVYIMVKFALTWVIPQAALIMFGIAFSVTIQLLLGAFSLDYQANENLCIDLGTRFRGASDGRGLR